MFVPGLDRLDGTAVNHALLGDEAAWTRHTVQVWESYEREILKEDGSNAEDRMTFVEFASEYATGKRETDVMRELRRPPASSKPEPAAETFDPDQEMSISLEDFLGLDNNNNNDVNNVSSSAPSAEAPAPVASRPEPPARLYPWSVDPYAVGLLKATLTSGGSIPRPRTPGLVLALGAGFPYKNALIRERLARLARDLRDAVGPGKLDFTPEHAMHVTVSTLVKFDEESESKVQEWTSLLEKSEAIANACDGGPVTLEASRVDVSADGRAVVLLLRDDLGRVGTFRKAVLAMGAMGATNEPRIPETIHVTLARVAGSMEDVDDARVRSVLAAWEAVEVDLLTLDAHVEREAYYFRAFPRDVVFHAVLAARRDEKLANTLSFAKPSPASSRERTETAEEEEEQLRRAREAGLDQAWMTVGSVAFIAVVALAANWLFGD